MIDVRPFATLGGANHGWLDAKHHFSFGGYRDPARPGWGRLLVWNDDAIAPGSGFPMHPHRDMEIVTVVRDGAISHSDSLGNSGRTVAGDVQVMSAGTGIRHAEFNAEAETTRIFQIWLLPDADGEPPRWDTRSLPRGDRAGRFSVLASGRPDDENALPLRADARVAALVLQAGGSATYDTAPGRHLYLVPSRGSVRVNGQRVAERDGAAITGESRLTVEAESDAEIVMVDAA
ncbi:pirin family protein [Rhizosaccharibacter radicis]|uniref:Pirin family protein n=1 Tax=Rhizosaccharibacter radicis TaxID=2782605 RepID=A0ABT1VT07_9PROT|nr:pirin family protein [Acetobacteraceae bacterium KSS12]